jgi:predicted HicB family RNase H-like nuclease
MNFGGPQSEPWNHGITTSTAAPTVVAAKPVDEAGEKLAAEMKIFNKVACELREKIDCDASFELRAQSIVPFAAELFGLAPTWTAFYREVLGANGLMKTAIKTEEEYCQFECSEEHNKLLEMLTALRSRDLPENDPHELQRMITVRIPKSLHDSICEEANRLSVSVNKLCISRLLQKIDVKMIPTSVQKRRGRRPGSASGSRLTSRSEPEQTVVTEFRGLEG